MSATTPRHDFTESLERVIDEAMQCGAGLGQRETLERLRRETVAIAFPAGEQRGFFTEKDPTFLEEVAAAFEKVEIRPKMPGPKHAEKARLETEFFRVRAARARSLAERIRKQMKAAGDV